MKKSESGFTIVELAVVIFVIALLATITLVSYAKITKNARTAQTVSAATQWIKALGLYKVRNGTLPNFSGCLGRGYNYGYNNDQSSGTAQCRQKPDGTGVTSSTTNGSGQTLTSFLKSYVTSEPTPAFVTSGISTDWRRGIYYYTGATTAYIDVVYDGNFTTTSDCPSINGVAIYQVISPVAGGTNNSVCSYTVGIFATYE